MNRHKKNNDGLTINFESACTQGKLYLRLQGHTSVQILNQIQIGEGVLQCIVFSSYYCLCILYKCPKKSPFRFHHSIDVKRALLYLWEFKRIQHEWR